MTTLDLPPVDYLRQRLRYEPETGKLFWKRCDEMPNWWNGRFAGKEAMTARCGNGYLTGAVNSTVYMAHRIAWSIYSGLHPAGEIDHINHVRDDNRICNLRMVSGSANCMNRTKAANNTSGVTGVGWDRSKTRWVAHIKKNGKYKALGAFRSFAEAVAARKEAEKMFGFHPNHGSEKPLAA